MPRWLGPRPSGYGVMPCAWQGWLATAIFALTLAGSRFIRWEAFGLPPWSRAIFVLLVIVGFLGLVQATYRGD